jgi:glycosyltransferase involved in cell wall biosynthesis
MNQALISGFTFVKNGLTLGYPVIESIKSIAPLCDEIVINVGFDNPSLTGDDGTYQAIVNEFQGPKYKILKSWWDPELTSGGQILSVQTNIALRACTGKYCQYIQADEAIHQDDIPVILAGITKMEADPKIEGLVYDYLHFYGNIDIIKHTRNIYRREVRLIRNSDEVISWKDAQGFRKTNGEKLFCQRVSARIFHYGWARQERVMNAKVKAFGKLYHGKDFENPDFNYERIWGLRPFKLSHPTVMGTWIAQNKNQLDVMALPMRFEWRNIGLAVSDWIEGLTGFRLGEYKNYRLP